MAAENTTQEGAETGGLDLSAMASRAPAPARRFLRSAIATLCLLLHALWGHALAEDANFPPPPEHTSEQSSFYFIPCSTYNPETGRFGTTGINGSTGSLVCPRGAAFMSLVPPLGKSRHVTYRPVVGECCPLPEGTLLDEHMSASMRCPDGWVVTGTTPDANAFHSAIDRRENDIGILNLRCTRLDSSRVKLGAATAGWRTGWGEEPLKRYFYSEDSLPQVTSRDRLPVELRYGIGRFGKAVFSDFRCIGFPFGSLMTALDGRECNTLEFRQLIDAKSGRPYSGNPDCIALHDPLGPAPRCLTRDDVRGTEPN